MSFLRPKYGRIREIAVEGVPFDFPKNEDEAQSALFALPDGFIRDFEWGLGIQQLFKPILQSVQRINGVETLLISTRQQTGLHANIFCLSYEDWENLRFAMNRIQRHYQDEGLIDRNILAYNEILHKHDSTLFPEKSRPYRKGSFPSLIRSS